MVKTSRRDGAEMISVVVGSQNPVKIRAAARGLAAVHGRDICVIGIALRLPLPDQPMSMEETLEGSRLRATHAVAAPGADLGVGLEGGLTQFCDQWYCVSWVTVADCDGGVCSAMGPAVLVPPPVMDLVSGGLELGDAEDQYYRVRNSKQNTGLVGIVTHGLVTREDVFVMPVTMALCSLRGRPVPTCRALGKE
jgi:inosine/xanthosine triphosphatase